MGAIRVTDEVHEYLNNQAKEDESLDAVVRRLIGYEKGDVKRKYVRRKYLIPRAKLREWVLDCFRAWDTTYVKPVTIRVYVQTCLNRLENKKQYLKDFEKDKKGQERWKNRLSSMIADLVHEGVLIHTVSDTRNWVGGSYSLSTEWLLKEWKGDC